MLQLVSFTLLLTVTSVSHAGKIYECRDANGNPVFSQTQCGDTVKEISGDLKKSGTFSSLESGRVLLEKKPGSGDDKASREYQEYVKRQNKLEGNIKWLEAEREKKLLPLQERRARAFSEYDRYKLDQQIAEVRKEYKARIDRMHRDIQRNHKKMMQ